MGDSVDPHSWPEQSLFAWESRQVRNLARYFYKRFEILRRDGFDDLYQESLIHWCAKRRLFDLTDEELCGPVMRRVIENKIMDIIESKHRQKRKIIYQTISLNDPAFERDEEENVKQFIADEESFRESFKCDIQDVMRRAKEKLSRRQRELCRLFEIDGLNWKEVSERLNIPRATLYEEVLRIREIFREEGLKDYL
jgi:RNA polymerase sigma-70 factor (ECF subfamily)